MRTSIWMATVLFFFWGSSIWGILLLKLLMPCFTCCCVLACGLGAGIAHLPEAPTGAWSGWWPWWAEIQLLAGKTSYGKGQGATPPPISVTTRTFKMHIFGGMSLLIGCFFGQAQFAWVWHRKKGVPFRDRAVSKSSLQIKLDDFCNSNEGHICEVTWDQPIRRHHPLEKSGWLEVGRRDDLYFST